MKVSLIIESDSELRKSVKEMIKGQVISITREEFFQIIRGELERKIKGSFEKNFDRMVNEAVKAAVVEILRQNHNVSNWSIDFIKPFIEKRLQDVLENKNINAIVNQMVKEKLKKLIDTE